MLANMVQGYLDTDLKTTAYFRNLEGSEKGTVSFLFAQAFSLWFAQEFMDIYHLVHVNNTGDSRNRTAYRKTWHHKPKSGASTPKQKSRPDFIGMCRNGYHVFESKGRSSGAHDIATALAQASRINTINGQQPITRVACCFSFLSSGVEGLIQDPEKDSFAFDLTFDVGLALKKAYAPFLSPDFRENKRDDILEGFLCLKIDEEVTIGIDKELFRYGLDRLDEYPYPHRLRYFWPWHETPWYPEIFRDIEKRRKSFKEDKQISLGRDGIILLDKLSSAQ